jgi:hypothetical protein
MEINKEIHKFERKSTIGVDFMARIYHGSSEISLHMDAWYDSVFFDNVSPPAMYYTSE